MPCVNQTFADYTKIMAIVKLDQKHSNAYLFEAYSELNLKAKNFMDLILGKPLQKDKDVILLNDPKNVELNQIQDIKCFHQVVQAWFKEHGNILSSLTGQVQHSLKASRILKELAKSKSQQITVVTAATSLAKKAIKIIRAGRCSSQ